MSRRERFATPESAGRFASLIPFQSSLERRAAAPQPGTAESLPADELRRYIRDLPGILALNGTWGGSDFKSIVNTLLETMTALVRVDIVLAKVAARPDGPADYFFRAPIPALAAAQHQLTPRLENYLRDQRLGAIANPSGQGTLRVVSVPIGVHAKWGAQSRTLLANATGIRRK